VTARRRALVFLARAPSHPGKTRLTSHLAADQAIELRRALLLDTLGALRNANVPIVLAFTPEDAEDEMRALVTATNVRFVPQRGADLGARMLSAMGAAFADGHESVVLVGSDLPSLPSSHLTGAFDFLDGGSDVVVGPADDGGYYLIGTRCVVPDIFINIAWGAADVFSRTRALAQSASLDVALLDPR
jgi:uncharacterized protein